MLHETYILDVKLQVVNAIKAYAVSNKMTQADMAYLLQTTQPRMSNMYRGFLDKFSIDTLLAWAYNLGIKATIHLD